MLRYSFFLIALLFLTITSHATTWNVGPSYDYPTPNALYLADIAGDIDIVPFDTILIESADYTGTHSLAAWQQNNLYILGEGEGDARPHMIADGAYILGKGIWVCVGNNITVDNIEFSEAVVPDNNGAGIRLDGIGLTLRNCYFHHNENGLLTSNPYDGDILIEYCEFAYNGYGDGFTHNMYIGHVNSFTLRYSYSHHTNVGHNVKSRANSNYIQYNFIADEETGNSSRLIDIPNGGYTQIQGNALMQGPNAINNNAVGYGQEGMSNPEPHQFYFVYNTLVNEREASCNFLDVEDGASDVYIVNNIFAGEGNLLVGAATTLLYNYKHDDIDHFQFEDETTYNYMIKVSSPVIDSGLFIMDGFDATHHYIHPTNQESRTFLGDRPDVGAYEFISPAGIFEETETIDLTIYPNPSNGLVFIETDEKFDLISVYNAIGEVVFSTRNVSSKIELNQPSGNYFVEMASGNKIIRKKLILN